MKLRNNHGDLHMPAEITTVEDFAEIAKRASKCLVKKQKDVVKLKLRTKKRLYTYKTDPINADRLLKNITCDIIEL